MIMLRPYQQDLIQKAREAYRQGKKAPCIVAPCGSGKTCITAFMAMQATAKRNRVLFIVHRQELCEQVEDTFRKWGVDMSLCHVAMVQTVCRHLTTEPEPQLIITDENHHAVSSSYKKIYDFFPKAKRVGVTATPCRLSGEGLIAVNDVLIEGVSTKWLIDNKYLAPYKYYSVTLLDLEGIKVRSGEYVASSIEQAMKKQAINGDVVATYRKLADGKKAICYAPTIALSQEMADSFSREGISAAHIDGNTPKEQRKEVIAGFRAGKIKILCNVDLISEGFDVPDCECAILLRPTKSLTLYIQQAMRCVRYRAGKMALIIAHVGNYIRFGLPDEPHEWSLHGEKKQSREAGESSAIQCEKCFFVYDKKLKKCPNCGYEKPQKTAPREIEEKKEVAIQEIKSFKLDYRKPTDCKSYKELLAYGKARGYKPGWAYFQAKNRGLL